MTELTSEQKQRIIEAVEQRLLQRFDHGSLKCEADFFAGAITAIMACLNEPDDSQSIPRWIPPMWTLWPMSGRLVHLTLRSREEAKQKREEQIHDAV